jgi:hypothetical protein
MMNQNAFCNIYNLGLYLFALVLASSSVGYAQTSTDQVKYEYQKSTKDNQAVHNFQHNDDLVIVSAAKKVTTGRYEAYITKNNDTYRWMFEKGKPGLLYHGEEIVVRLEGGLFKINNDEYKRADGATKKQWNYKKGGETILACTFQKESNKRYIILEQLNSDDPNLKELEIIAMYYGQTLVSARSSTPALIIIAALLGASRGL